MSSEIAVILVNYNGTNDTIECVKSIMNSEEPADVFVVDNDSSESQRIQLHKALEDLCVIIDAPSNLGFSGGNNLGITKAVELGYKYCLILNNDTIVSKECIGILKRECRANRIVAPKIYNYYKKDILWAAGGFISKVTGKGKDIGEGTKDPDPGDTVLKKCSFLSGCCLMIPVSAFEKTGLFEQEYFLYYEDVDFSLKARKNEIDLLYVPSAIIWHKDSGTSGKKSKITEYYLTRNRLHIINKYNEYFWPTAKIISYLTFYTKIMLCMLKQNPMNKVYIKAIHDYENNITGKTELE